MKKSIVHTASGITVLGGGKVNKAQIRRAVKFAPDLVAADRGALLAVKHGWMPVAVIGDMDGDAAAMVRAIAPDRIHRIAEQDSTDFEKCLYSVSARFVIALGMTGSRLDHSLAAFNAVLKYPQRTVIILSGRDLCFLCPPKLVLDLPVGTRFSLFPMAPVRGRSVGLEWPIDGLAFSTTGRIGTSNRTIAREVSVEFDAPVMLVILPAKHLGRVIEALAP